MRRTTTTLLLACVLALAACRDDVPEETSLTQGGAAAAAGADTTPPAEMMRTVGTALSGAAPAGAAPADTTGEAAIESVEASVGQRLYTIQLAAFTSADSAVHWTGRLRDLDLPVWMSMAERGGMTFYRVRVGAAESFAEARRLGVLMGDRLHWPVWVTSVDPQDRPPENAVAATRRLLSGD